MCCNCSMILLGAYRLFIVGLDMTTFNLVRDLKSVPDYTRIEPYRN